VRLCTARRDAALKVTPGKERLLKRAVLGALETRTARFNGSIHR
jgi:hypothetical protein